MNQLAIRNEDVNVLLNEKNILNESIIDKYRTAGKITETGLQYAIDLINQTYHYKTKPPLAMAQLCTMIDSLLCHMLEKVYTKCEKSITIPTSFNVNEVISNFSPELDDTNDYYFSEGDIITINLGVQIDGYSSNVSHTICIYPPGDKPIGPLLGNKADCVIANHLCTKIVIALLGLSNTPEKLPEELRHFGGINGTLIKHMCDVIVKQFNCRILPGSEIRQIRRFLSGQNELLQEKGYHGLKWDELDQELDIMQHFDSDLDAIFGDTVKNKRDNDKQFQVKPGNIYQIDLKVASINDCSEIGIITTETINNFTGVNNKVGEFKMKPTIYVRDFIMTYQLKLKSSRSLLGKIDKKFPVYPFKLNYLSEKFPLTRNSLAELDDIKANLNDNKLALNEIVNHNLVNPKPINIIKFLPYKSLLESHSLVSANVNKEKLTKHCQIIDAKSIESTTILVNNLSHELIQLSNNFEPVHCQSNFNINEPIVEKLFNLLHDKRFGITLKKVNPLIIQQQMELD